MKGNLTKWIVGLGAACAAVTAAACWYSVQYNDARLVVPMDFSEYSFQVRDLPMIGAISLVVAYALFLAALWLRAMVKETKRRANQDYTRRINPNLGLLGFWGSWGF